MGLHHTNRGLVDDSLSHGLRDLLRNTTEVTQITSDAL
jgi:hypothetical protein